MADLVLVRPMRVALFVFIGLAVLVAPTRADEARVEVARLDGAPVYHWRVFHSHYGDDVDRALILREYGNAKMGSYLNIVYFNCFDSCTDPTTRAMPHIKMLNI